jgi:hypothetical protein
MKKNIVKLTESDLVKLIKKMINEQEHHDEGSEAFEHYVLAFEDVYKDTFMSHHEGLTEEDMDIALDNLAQVLDHAEGDENVSDDEFEELYEMYKEMVGEMHIKFDTMYDLNETIDDEDEEDEEELEKEMHPALTRQLRHFDPDEFTLIGKIQVVKNKMAKTPNFVLRTRNKTEDGTRILAGIELLGYEDKIVKLTGRTKDGNPPSFQNPLKLTKRPQVLSR